MEEKFIPSMEAINEADLEDIAGGVSSGQKHVKITNCKHACNVRSSANSRSDDNIIGKAYLNDRYVFYGWRGNWAKIQYGSTTAYVFKDFVDII